MASVITTRHTLIQVDEARGDALQPSKSNIVLALVANTAKNILMSDLTDVDGKLPTYISFSGLGNFYVLWNGTGATIPSGDNLAGTGPELNPSLRKLAGITQFSIISPTSFNLISSLFIGQ